MYEKTIELSKEFIWLNCCFLMAVVGAPHQKKGVKRCIHLGGVIRNKSESNPFMCLFLWRNFRTHFNKSK